MKMCGTNKQDDQKQGPRFSHENNATDDGKSMPRKANFEVALEETKFGKLNYLLIFVSGTILGTVIFETMGISFVLPVTDCDLNFTTAQKGMLSAIGFIGIITSSHLWGFLADTKGRRRIIRPTLQIAFVITVVSSFLNDFWSLIIFRFLTGFFISGGSATIYAFLGEFHTDKSRSKAIMAASVVFGMTALFMPACAWLVINQDFRFYVPFLNIMYKPWRLFMVVCGLPGFICSICLYIIPESPKYTLLHKGQNETIAILRKVYAINTGDKGINYPITFVEKCDEFVVSKEIAGTRSNPIVSVFVSMWRQTSPLFERNFLRQTILGCLLQFLAFLTGNGMYMWFPDVLNQIANFRNDNPNAEATICQIIEQTATRNANLNSTNNDLFVTDCKETLDITTYQYSLILEVFYIIGFVSIGIMINAVGKIYILFVIFVATGASAIALIFAANHLLSIYLFLIVLSAGLASVVINAATVDLFPTSLRGMAVCITMMFGRAGSVLGANVVGLLLDLDCEAAFIFSGTTLIFAGFLGFLLPKGAIQVKKTPQTDESNEISCVSNSV